MTQRTLKRLFSKKPMVTGLIVFLSLVLVGAASCLAAAGGKSSAKGYLGVSVERLSSEEKEELNVTHGVIVTRVTKGEAADKAGMEEDDVIQFFNDEKIRRPGNLVDAVRECKPGTQAKVKLVRDGKAKEVTVTLGKLKSRFHGFDWGDHKGYIFIPGKGGYLGVHLQTLNKDLAEYFGVKDDEGALILKIEEKSPAEEAGLKAGDVITQLEGKNISNPEAVSDILSDLEEGDEVTIQVIRHKKKRTVKAELEERPGFRNIKIQKGLGDIMHFKHPCFHFYMPDFQEYEFTWRDKLNRKLEEKLKGVEEKVEKKLKKLKNLKEYIYI
jgi:C-terminal processing protease CtpA/Prc